MTLQTDKDVALSKLNRIVAEGAARAIAGMSALAQEYNLRRDWIVKKPESLEVDISTGKVRPVVNEVAYDLTPHARTQLLTRAGIPLSFADRLEEHSLAELLRTNIRTLLPRVSEEGLLVRTVSGTAKGILSPSYKVMDTSPLFEDYLRLSMAGGMVPYQGSVTDTRAFLSMLDPTVREIGPGEYVVLGTELRNSDYGNGALDLSLSALRLLCVNGMVGFSMLRKVHLGRRFADTSDAQVIDVSARTLRLDNATSRSALKDALGTTQRHLLALEAALKDRVSEKVDLSTALATLTKKGIKKATVEKVKDMYEQTGLPVEAVPQEPGAWRFAQVLSLLANGAKGDEAHDLQEAAYNALLPQPAAVSRHLAAA